MGIDQLLKEKLMEAGASIVGFADLGDIGSAKELGLTYGISIAVALKPNVVNNLYKGVTNEYEKEYVDVNNQLDELALLASQILRKEGYNTHVQTTTKVVTNEAMESKLPHKTVATRAGLGWIGKCALLVTPEYGSAIRLTSLLTNAELKVGKPINKSKCGQCNRCVTLCPGTAVEGVNWQLGLHRSDYYNHVKCRTEARRRSELNNIYKSLCGICILACPYTEKFIRRHELVYNGNSIETV